jgi:hypothetical protein
MVLSIYLQFVCFVNHISNMQLLKRLAMRKHTENDRLDHELAAAVSNAIVNSRCKSRGCQDIGPDRRKQSGRHAHGRHVRFVDECEKPAAPTQEADGEPTHCEVRMSVESSSADIGNTSNQPAQVEACIKLCPANLVDLVLRDWNSIIEPIIALGDLNGRRSCSMW